MAHQDLVASPLRCHRRPSFCAASSAASSRASSRRWPRYCSRRSRGRSGGTARWGSPPPPRDCRRVAAVRVTAAVRTAVGPSMEGRARAVPPGGVVAAAMQPPPCDHRRVAATVRPPPWNPSVEGRARAGPPEHGARRAETRRVAAPRNRMIEGTPRVVVCLSLAPPSPLLSHTHCPSPFLLHTLPTPGFDLIGLDLIWN